MSSLMRQHWCGSCWPLNKWLGLQLLWDVWQACYKKTVVQHRNNTLILLQLPLLIIECCVCIQHTCALQYRRTAPKPTGKTTAILASDQSNAYIRKTHVRTIVVRGQVSTEPRSGPPTIDGHDITMMRSSFWVNSNFHVHYVSIIPYFCIP